MNIDQRIEALARSTEKLKHSTEILAQRQNSFDANLDRLFDYQTRNEELHKRNEEFQAKNEKFLAGLMESVDSLARIALAHENRRSDLEGLN
jgi:hypothetical protein